MRIALRAAEPSDRSFLEEMTAVAADWRNPVPMPGEQMLSVPELAHYIVGWPALGDVGIVAEDIQTGRPVGAAWWRWFPDDDPGYGFVDSATPELAIGVIAEARGRGVGTALLHALLDVARERGPAQVSLSVELDNPSRRIYQRAGFRDVSEADGAATMLWRRPAG